MIGCGTLSLKVSIHLANWFRREAAQLAGWSFVRPVTALPRPDPRRPPHNSFSQGGQRVDTGVSDGNRSTIEHVANPEFRQNQSCFQSTESGTVSWLIPIGFNGALNALTWNNAGMRCASVKILVAIAILLTVAITSCGTDESTGNSVGSGSVSGVGSTPPLDPATATLDEILERSRIAMGDVTSYKIRGAVVTEISIGSDFVISQRTDEFRVWQSPDRLHIRSESAASGFRDAHLTEIVFMGEQVYSRSGTTGWQQPELFSPSRWSEQTYSAHVIVLDAPDMKLVSRNEETDDGTKV